jgi:hypothetical protein
MTKHTVLVDFDPLKITLPGAGPFVGTIEIMLPEHHFKLVGLSMGMDLLDGAHIGGDARMWAVTIPNVPEPGMEASDLLQFIEQSEPQLRELWALVQKELDKAYLLEGNRPS